ncbi:hypothetical protein GF377_00995 [candidate division GN15 bacterium]|nr:hypothetical protein [candidate division GN15 bacterium]
MLLQYRYGVMGVILLATLGVFGCATFHTRMFEDRSQTPKCVDEFCFAPRIVAFQDVFGEQPVGRESHGFWTTIKIYDTSIDASMYLDDDMASAIDLEERNRRSDAFKDRMLGLFRMDSLALVLGDDVERVVVLPDTSKYEPRDVNYISYFFGRVDIPPPVAELDAVFYYSRTDNSGMSHDSLSYLMHRVEESAFAGGVDDVIGALKGVEESDEPETTEDAEAGE